MKITIIGGGPGGYVAALKAAILGAEVHLVEKKRLGGTCLNQGCIPTKAYLSCADLYDGIMKAPGFGIDLAGEATIDFGKIYQRKHAVVKQLVDGVTYLLNKRKVTVYQGTGSLVSNHAVKVTFEDGQTETIETDRIIIATGSVPILPPLFKFDGKQVISSDEALQLDTLPASMIIVGGGVIGCEFGQFFRKMGVEVSIVEMLKTLLPMEDPDVSQILQKKMKKEKVAFYLGKGVETVDVGDGSVTCTLTTGETLTAEKMLVSIGRRANTASLGLEELGIAVERGKIVVDETMRTSLEDVYAIGDVVDTPFLAHVASKEGAVAVETIMGRKSRALYHAVPRCVYTEPEIAAVGITEKEAAAKGIDYRTGKFIFAGIGKAMVIGKTEGFVKVITDEADRIIGASVTGAHATDLLAELTLCVHLGLTARDLGEVIHPHPTLSEAIMEAAHDVHNEAAHSF